MIPFFQALLINPLLQYSIIAAVASSIVGGVIGSYVVIKRIAFISGGIAHSVLAGIGLCLWLNRMYGWYWLSPIYGAFAAAILSALLIGRIHLYYRQREDSVIAALWSVGMAIGVLFLSGTPGSNVDLDNYLLGNILWVSFNDLILLIILDIIVIIIVSINYNRFLLLCFDEEQAKLQGINVQALYLLLLVLIAITVVLLIQIVGIILAITLLVIPATISNIFTKNLVRMMVSAVIISSIFCFSGTVTSYYLNLPTGATIALTAAIVYMLCLSIRSRRIKTA